MKVASAITFFSLLASSQATGSVRLSMIPPKIKLLTPLFYSTGALRSVTRTLEDRQTSVTITSKRASAGLISLLARSQATAASPSPVSPAAMALDLALASVA